MENVNKPNDQHSAGQKDNAQGSKEHKPGAQPANEQGSKGQHSGNFGDNQPKTEVKTPTATVPNSAQGGVTTPQTATAPAVNPVK